MKNTFLKSFSSLQNEKTCFWSVFQVDKKNKHVLEAFVKVYKNEKTRYGSVFQVYKMQKHVLKRLSKFTKWKTWFWSVSQVHKMIKHVFEAFSSSQNKKGIFFERFSKITEWKNTF